MLGSIPGTGAAVRDHLPHQKNRTELIALITPRVIEDIEQAADLTEELKSTLKGLEEGTEPGRKLICLGKEVMG